MKKNYFAKNLNKSFITLSVIFCAFLGTSGFAQKNIAWTGATDTNWSTPTNWNYPAITSVATFAAAPEISPIVIFTGSTTTLTLTGNVKNNGTAASNIPVGARVSGVGIAPNTTVTAVGDYDATAKTTPITLSTPTTAASDVAGNKLLFQFDTKITLKDANTEIAVGDSVSGYGIPMGTKIVAIDGTQKIITISGNNLAGVGTPGTNVQFTFATPKVATGAPTIVDIALINNGANLTLAGGSYYLGGLTISNTTGPVTGSTLTIPADAEVFVETITNEGVLIKGGNIINNGFLDIKSSLTGGSNNTAGAYGITFGRPDVVPTVPTEYMISGNGTLKIDTSAGNNFSGGMLFNGADANAGNATYKLLFNGTYNFLLSATKAAAGTASTQLFRAVGIGTLQTCKIIVGGTGFDMGDALTGSVNGLIAASGGGIDFTIAPETTINIFSGANNGNSIMSMYVFGATSIPSFIKNKGKITIKGLLFRSPISLSAQNNGIVNVVNDGILDIDVNSTSSGQGGIAITNNGGATLPADVIVTNNGTMSIKTLLNGPSWGAPIVMTTFSGAPNLHIINTGTLNLVGSNHNFGSKVFNPDPLNTTQTGVSRITNSGTINTNQEFRAFYTINTSTGKITFKSTNESPLKLATFTVDTVAAAAVGTTYTDSNANVHTVVVAKVAATGTTLVTHVSANAVNPPTITAVVDPPVAASALTKTGAGAGDASIVFKGLTTNNNSAFFAATLNSGTINTNTGTTAMTSINGVRTPDPTSVLSPGGDTGNGQVTYAEITGDAITLLGTLKMQATGSTTVGVDFDQLKLTGSLDTIDISAATLDLTGIYKPTTAVTLDIITTNTTLDNEGAVVGEFASVVGKPAGWSVVYAPGLGSKVQLVYDPALAVPQFADAKFSYYPNPTSGELNVSAAKNISKVELFNMLGQKVQSNSVNANEKQLNMSNLQNGLYLMEVTIDDAKQSFKVVKQ